MFSYTKVLILAIHVLCPSVSGYCDKCPRYDLEYKVIEIMVNLENCYNADDTEVASLRKQLEEVLASARGLRQNSFSLRKPETNTGGSTTYIRWGRTVCPGNGSSLVYDGYAAGSSIVRTGGGANRLCLPKNPSWSSYNDTHDPTIGGIFAVFYDRMLSHTDKVNKAVPCAVCKVNRQTMLMIPAKTTCPSGWTTEYVGYLVGGRTYEDLSASEFVCLDADMEALGEFDGQNNTNRAIFSQVEARCPSTHNLECPPYVHSRELTCVVCTIDG